MIRKNFQATILILALSGAVGCGRLSPTLRFEHTIKIEGSFTHTTSYDPTAPVPAEVGSAATKRSLTVEVAAVR